MKTKNIHLKDLHFEHKVWANELQFVKEETQIFDSRLEEISSKNSSQEILTKVEHFQNQFIREREVIDELLHEMNKHEDALSDFAVENPTAVDHRSFRDHGEMRNKVETFRNIYGELKKNFLEFLSEWM